MLGRYFGKIDREKEVKKERRKEIQKEKISVVVPQETIIVFILRIWILKE